MRLCLSPRQSRQCCVSEQFRTPFTLGEVLSMLQPTTSSTPKHAIQPDQKTTITERVRGEFREMPGLTLTLAQAVRLWSLDTPTCREVLSQLVDTGFLSRRVNGAFCRTSDMAARRFVEA